MHYVSIEGYGEARVDFKCGARGLEVITTRTVDTHQSNTCISEPICKARAIPSLFRDDVDAALASAIVRKILSSDFLVASRFERGQTVRLLVPKTHPNSVAGSPSTLGDVRRRTQSLGAFIRPCLLASLAGLDRLHEYQRDGVAWLASKRAAILADDMGLGKTAQAIASLRLSFREGPLNSALVICPKQLMANWERELAIWAPELSWSRVTPPSAWRSAAWKGLFNRVHVLITNYEQTALFRELGSEFQFSSVVLDEAHRVRNASANVTSYLRKINRERTWALTGTPLERAPSDLWTILSIVEPRRFNVSRLPPSEETLRARLRPYILRRMKRDYLPELPPEVDEHETIELLPKQRQAYDIALARIRSATEGDLLAGLNELRALCDLDQRSGQSVKLDRIISILQDVASNNEKAVIFSHLLSPLDALAEMLDRQRMGYVQIRGEQSVEERDKALSRFDCDDSIPFLLASTRVGGEGLNLVGANHVVFVNRWWNPSANNQAKDRVSRMGQERTVVIHSFTCRDTIEEALEGILEEKRRLAENIVESLVDPIDDASIRQEVATWVRRS